MPNDKDQGIVVDEKAQEQPKDEERARKKDQQQHPQRDDELQPLREKSGF